MILTTEEALAGYRSLPLARLGDLHVDAGDAAALRGTSGGDKITILLAIVALADQRP